MIITDPNLTLSSEAEPVESPEDAADEILQQRLSDIAPPTVCKPLLNPQIFPSLGVCNVNSLIETTRPNKVLSIC